MPFDEESLFARDADDQLIRLDKATEELDSQRDVEVEIDGQSTRMARATPTRDSLGTIQRDADGRTKPRFTTIYDAANQLVAEGKLPENPIPVLCHRDHLH